MAIARFYFDTYALIERTRGNPAYAPFEDEPITTHQMNLYELASHLLKSGHGSRIREVVNALQPNEAEATLDDLILAASFRLAHPGKRVSYVDALGYVLAQNNGLRFLTGDKVFKGLDNVEYVV